MSDRLERVRASMLWAAWADALGFISELTSAENLRRRTRGRELTHPMTWSRIIGGRGGVRAELPEGCYSDDTQLRLATARTISSHGFDVEAFARVELTVWPSYALGGGRASRAAASAMTKQRASWANNFFDGWQNAGGNGAAMRIQPHVYAARELTSFHHIDDVVRNSVVTHGHPRAVVGAVFHAVCLTVAIDTGRVPDVSDFGWLLTATHDAISAFSRQPELHDYWLPQWERKTEMSFEVSWHKTVDEVEELLRSAIDPLKQLRRAAQDRSAASESYESLVRALQLDDESSRGSATTTTVAALILATAFPDHPAQAAQIAASRLHTDTDTIGTMAAALVGAASPRNLSTPVLDQDYLELEARRLNAIACGLDARPFRYPDLLLWQPPKTALDAVGTMDGQLALAGIGTLTEIAEPIRNRDAEWVWTTTNFGQTILVKRRHNPHELPPERYPASVKREGATLPGSFSASIAISGTAGPSRPPRTTKEILPQPTLFDVLDSNQGTSTGELLTWLEENNFQDAAIGRAMKTAVARSSLAEVTELAEEIARRLHRRMAN